MTFAILEEIIKKNNIPKDVHLMSDSGWEGWETEMDGVYYYREENLIIFTQEGCESDTKEQTEKGGELIYRKERGKE